LKPPCYHIGRKAIIAFLTPYLDIPQTASDFVAWQKVRRWRDGRNLPVEITPMGKPYIDENTFFFFWTEFQRIHKTNK
jgi:hypothetical protein